MSNRSLVAVDRIGWIGRQILVVVVHLEIQREVLARLPEHADSPAGQLHAFVAGVRAFDVVVAVALLAVGREAHREGVADRQVDRALRAETVVVGDRALEVAGVTAIDDRVVRCDEHRAARGVLADEGALRAAQDFHARDVVVRLGRVVARKGRHAVAIGDHARGRLRVVLGLADAADVEVDALAEIVDHRRGRYELQLVDHRDAGIDDLVARHDRRRDRSLLQIRATPLGGHDDLVELMAAVVALLSRGLCAAGTDVAICAAANTDARSIFFMRFPLEASSAIADAVGGVSHSGKRLSTLIHTRVNIL